MNDSARLAPVGDGTWTSGSGTITICNVEYLLLFDKGGCNGPCLTLRRNTGSGFADYVCVRDVCGCGYAIFSIGHPDVCTGAPSCGACSNVARIKVAFASCAYTGAGWYCVRACGSTGNGVVANLIDTDDTGDIEILSGPYDTEEEAATACGGDVGCGAGLGETYTTASKLLTFGGSLAAFGVIRVYWTGAGWHALPAAIAGLSTPCGPVQDIALLPNVTCTFIVRILVYDTFNAIPQNLDMTLDILNVHSNPHMTLKPFVYDSTVDPPAGITHTMSAACAAAFPTIDVWTVAITEG